MNDQQTADLTSLKTFLDSQIAVILEADWTLPVPPGLQENPAFLGEHLQKVDSFSDTLSTVMMDLTQSRSSYKDFLSQAKAVYENARKKKMLEIALDPTAKKLSQELLGYQAEQSLLIEKAQLNFAEACVEAFKDTLDVLDVKRKQLSHKRSDLLGMVGVLRSSTFLHRGPTEKYQVNLRESGPVQF